MHQQFKDFTLQSNQKLSDKCVEFYINCLKSHTYQDFRLVDNVNLYCIDIKFTFFVYFEHE